MLQKSPLGHLVSRAVVPVQQPLPITEYSLELVRMQSVVRQLDPSTKSSLQEQAVPQHLEPLILLNQQLSLALFQLPTVVLVKQQLTQH
jgi:hypothetical protein